MMDRKAAQAPRDAAPTPAPAPAPADGEAGKGGRRMFMFGPRRAKQDQQQEKATVPATASSAGEPDVLHLTKVVGFMLGKLKFKVRDESLAMAACICAASKGQSDAEALCAHYGIAPDAYKSHVQEFMTMYGLESESQVALWVKEACWPDNR